MPVTIKYIGTADNYAELPVTGKQSVWQVGQQEERPDNEAALLMATGLFSSPPVPVFASANLTGGIGILTGKGENLNAVFAGAGQFDYQSVLQNALSAAWSLRGVTTAPSTVETIPAISAGTRYYIDPNHPASSNSNAGTSPDAPWKDFWKLNGLNPGAGAVINIAADAVFDYGYSWAAYKARTNFPYNSGDNLNGTDGAPVVIRSYSPRQSAQKKPVVRLYAVTSSSDWTAEGAYPGVWSAALSVSGNNYRGAHCVYGQNDTVAIAAGHNLNGPSQLTKDGQWAVDANKVYFYSASGNPVSVFGSVKVFGQPLLGSSWNGMRYLKIFGIRFELCRLMTLDFSANAATVHGGVEIAGCDFYKSRLGFVRNQQTNATAQELPLNVHHCYFQDVLGGALHINSGGTTGNTVSWEFWMNSVNGANLDSGFGGVLYNQSKGGTRHHAWSNYGKNIPNGVGTNIDGAFLYSDLGASKSIFYANIVERTGVPFQTNSAYNCFVVGNLAVDCWKMVQTTGTGTDTTPDMHCIVAHNSWIWTGRISKTDLQIGAGVANAVDQSVCTQWNDQKSAGRKYANYAFLNNLAASAVETDRPFEYHQSAGITTLSIGGNAVYGMAQSAIHDSATDVSGVAENIVMRGSSTEAAGVVPGISDGAFRPFSGSSLVGSGVPLSVQYQDITGRNFNSPPTPGCFEAGI